MIALSLKSITLKNGNTKVTFLDRLLRSVMELKLDHLVAIQSKVGTAAPRGAGTAAGNRYLGSSRGYSTKPSEVNLNRIQAYIRQDLEETTTSQHIAAQRKWTQIL